jgi:2-polyprenyl-3-methyl-5-hydroxy-6-metoxy-1,4-benzoquinol methylase
LGPQVERGTLESLRASWPTPVILVFMDEFMESNRALWDEWTRIHVAGGFYDVASFKDGRRPNRLRAYEMEEVGDVSGKDLLHVQCHFGLDSLSWARLGARVTGVDYSEEAIAAARKLAEEIGIEATFIRSNVYDMAGNLATDFDIVYMSRGVLGWLPDLKKWASAVATVLRPGGLFYITEIHPVAQVFDDERSDGLHLRHPYWEGDEPLVFPVRGSYADAVPG